MPEGVGEKNVQLPSGEVVAFPGDMPDAEINKHVRRHLIGKMGEENARRLAPAPPEPGPEPLNISAVMGPGGRGGISTYSGGPPPEVGAAALVGGLALPAVLNPVALAKGAAYSYAGSHIGGELGNMAESVGAPRGTAAVTRVVGALAGPGIGPRVLGGSIRGRITQAFIGESKKQIKKQIKKQAGGAAKGAGKTLGDIIHMEPTKTLKEGAARHVAASASRTVDKAWLEFVKKEGPKFKANSEVWFVKDASGTPLRTFETSAKAAGWVRRAENKGKGYVADFFKNFWGSSKPASAVTEKAKTVGGLIEPAKTGEPWRVVIQYGKHKGKSGIKVKHGMGRGQTRVGGSQGPRHDTIRLDDGSEVVVPSTSVLTDFGKATHPSVQKAIDASRAK